jgi:uncharacterized membrane protein (UPF0127 family)
MSDLILVGVSFDLFDFVAAKTREEKLKIIKNMKKNLTKLTIFCFFLFNFNLSAFAKEVASFNNNFKNYNRILEIFDENKKISQFKVAIAISDAERQYGLMNLEKLPENYGMVFEFLPSQIVRMWMKNTLIPLDMLFIDAENKILTIKENTVPHSLKIISSQKNVVKVLEINAGEVKKFKIKTGFKVKLN